MSRKLIFPVLTLAILVLTVLGLCLGYFIYTRYLSPPDLTLPAPLENVDFSTMTQQYPANWPDDLKFPDDFILVDLSSGKLPESTVQGWAIKLIFKGSTSESAKAISSYLETEGWTIVESKKLDSGGFVLLLERQEGSGIITLDLDPSNPSQTLIVGSIFP